MSRWHVLTVLWRLLFHLTYLMNFRIRLRVFACGCLGRERGTGLFLVGEGEGSAPHVVGMDETVEEGVDCQQGHLEEPVEVHGGVVGHEGGAEVHVPGHDVFEL